MMAVQSSIAIRDLLTKIIEENLSLDIVLWLQDNALHIHENNGRHLNLCFSAIPRKTGRKAVVVEDADMQKMNSELPGFTIQHWTIDRVCRVWLLLQLETTDREKYINLIENLFPQAEINESVALYAALPLLAYPAAWKMRCAAGIRSNIGTVLEAIMYNNPYPAAWLDEPAWNQLVMKAFFTDKNVNNIIGLDKRANRNLANILFDYTNERWAAHRSIDPQIGRLIQLFMDPPHFYMVEKMDKEHNKTDFLQPAHLKNQKV